MRTPPEHIVQNGKPVFGTFNAPFKKIAIQGLRHPFGNLPFPSFFTKFRIRSSLSFAFIFEDYLGLIDISDTELFGSAELSLWNMQSGKKNVYRKFVGLRRGFVPENLEKAKCFTLSATRDIRITWDRPKNRFTVGLIMKEKKPQTSLLAYFTLDLNSNKFAQISSVSPAPISRRCSAMYQLTAPFTGLLNFAGQDKSTGLGYFSIKQAYYPLRTKSDTIIGIGLIDDKQVSFRISSSSITAIDSDSYNDNVLFLDGKVIPLPPVRITRPDGLMGHWIIQDTESMIDLSFKPVSDNCRRLSAFVIRTEVHIVYGVFEGFLATDEGESIVLKNFAGLGKKVRLRL